MDIKADNKHVLKIGVLVASDKGFRGEREDKSGPALQKFLANNGIKNVVVLVLPDERARIADALVQWVDNGRYDLILTCGGTGVSPRDVTPQATADVIATNLPGFGEAMRAASMGKSPHAIISRAIAGIRGNTLIVNLPGSPVGAVENLEAVWPAVPHTIAKLQGDQSECAQA
ncbi:MAG: molybdopterin adenylyltransferase [Candidatus Krumholzibacteriia bacterium]|jgi:molybdopterin adenylyltransferase